MKIKVKVTTHEGYFSPNNLRYLFITVKNETNKNIWIENVFIKDDTLYQIIQKQRPTPFLLPSGNTWETWVGSFELKNKITDLYDNAYALVRYENSYKMYKIWSVKDQHVSPIGVIPNGEW